MKYSQLAEVYEKLENTAKRLEKTHILSEFLRETPAEDVDKVILLIQGRAFPRWDERKIGFASRMMIKALEIATGLPKESIEESYRKKGDLGITAEELAAKKRQRTLFSSELTVSKVFDNIQKLTTLEGEGSVDRKIKLVAELLSSAKPKEARYIARTVLEELRVGLGEGTIRDAIVWAFFREEIGLEYEEKKNNIRFPEQNRDKYNYFIDIVQNAYDAANDFSVVARAAKKEGEKGVKAIELVLGKPVKVMLAQKVEDVKEGFERVGEPAAIEYKYDGFRCVTGHTPIYVYKKGLLSIKDIKKNDLVLSHKGRFRKVTATNKRKIGKKERLFNIQSFLGNEFRISEGHAVLTEREGKLKWINSESLVKKDLVAFPIPSFTVKDEPPGKKLYLKDSSNYSKLICPSLDFFRFLGYWIGDGFTNEYHNTERVGLVFNKDHTKKIKKYRKIITKTLKITKISESRQRMKVSLYWRDKPLRIWLSALFRREWKGKMLPEWFYNLSKQQFLAFLEGWIDSDGHTDSLGRSSITTKERDLAMFAQLVALKHRVVIALKKFRIGGKTYYKLMLLKSKKHYKIKGNYILVKLLKLQEIKRRDPRTLLYNLQIKDDESYCTTLFSLHNCQIHRNKNEISIFTRRLENVTKQFPDIAKAVREQTPNEVFILDSEVVGYNPETKNYLPFQNISQRIKRKYEIERMAKEFPVEVNVFDILYYNDKNTLKIPFKERRGLIEKLINPKKWDMVLAKQLVTGKKAEAEKFYKESLEIGQEGVMMKKLEAPYKPGSRVGFMVKLKPTMKELDLVIVGAEWGTGKRAGWLSSYVLACRDEETGEFLEVGKVGTGIKEKEEQGVSFQQLTDLLKPLITSEKGNEVRIRPEVVVEVTYEEIQKSPTYSSGYALRFPRLLRLREDRSSEDASTSAMVKAFYKEQRKAGQ